MFSDEKIFRMVPGVKCKIWARSRNHLIQDKFLKSHPNRQGLMVWCAINSKGEICLRRCPNKVNSLAYQNILESAMHFIKPRYIFLWRFLKKKNHTFSLLRAFPIRFQQDGASVHTSVSTTEWLKKKQIKLFNGGVWPALSPDMNPVEHVWPYVTRALIGQAFPNRDSLWDALQVAFAAIPKEAIRNLYASMPNRILALRKARGRHTKY